MWQIKKLPFYIDLIFCLVLLPAMMTLLPIERWLINNSLFVYLLVSWLYIVYILNRRFIMPFMFAGKKRFWMAVSLILLTAVGTYLITRYQMEVPLHHMKRTRLLQHIPKIKLQQQAVWFLYVVVIAFSAAVGLLTQLYHQIMERQAVEFEKKKAELALYKAQINPHFLFNNLNTLYAMVVTGSPKTEDAFIQFIRQYIELQKYRIAENFDVHFSYVHDETEQMNIVPMILITFVENVFKHGVSSHKKGEAYITIRAEKGELLLATNNPLLNHPDSKASKGIGIENCKKRLDLLYPNRYSLFTGEREGKYAVTLSINLRQ